MGRRCREARRRFAADSDPFPVRFRAAPQKTVKALSWYDLSVGIPFLSERGTVVPWCRLLSRSVTRHGGADPGPSRIPLRWRPPEAMPLYGGVSLTERGSDLFSTISTGKATELMCQAYFTLLGYNVSVPVAEDCKYDMILDVNGLLLRIQIKTCTETRTGIVFPNRSVTTSGKTNVIKKYTSKDIDYIAVYYHDRCYLIPITLCESYGTRTLSFEKKKVNGQTPLWLNDFEAETVIQEVLSSNQHTKHGGERQ